MKKSLLAVLLIALASPAVFGQFAPPIDTVYTENFDGTLGADSIAANYNTDSTNATRSWNDTTYIKTTGNASFHTQIYASDSIVFETDAFTTVTYTNVRLTFDHICKIRYIQKAFIQMSRDNGATWVNLTSSHYQGGSPQFSSQGWFNELSYPSQLLTPYWYGPTIGNSNTGTGPTPNTASDWWARETFDLSSYLGTYDNTNSQYGYANCKLRFIMSNKTGTPSPAALDGWFVDNIMVEGAPCELEPPTIDWVNVSVPAKPIGARYMPTQAVRVKGKDNVGVDSMRIYMRRYDYSASSWGTWTDSLMSSSFSSNCPDSSQYTYTFGNIDIHDTIEWYVRIFDCACPNVVRDPLESASIFAYKFWRDAGLPPICGTTTQNSFPYSTTLPVDQDFENNVYWVAGSGSGATGVSHRGNFPDQNPPYGLNYKVIPNENTIGFAWSIRTGSTETNLTGPDGDASPNGGGKYIYTEAEQGSANDKAHFITPCLDLRSYNCAILEFDYHMYGAHVDFLAITADTGFNTSSYTGLARIDGQKQSKSSDPFKTFSVALNDITGDYARIRFSVNRGNSLKGDVAIDNIRIYEPAAYEVALREVFNPENGYCSYSNNETIDLWIQNNGCTSLDSVPITWEFDYTNTSGSTTNQTHTEYITNKTLETGDSTFYTFGTGPNLSGYGIYDIWVYTEQPGDTVATNDTIGPIRIVHEEPYATFPYVLDFDGAATTAGNNTAANAGSFPNNVWTPVPAGNSGEYAFMVGDEWTPTIGSGPITDKSGQGNYLVAEGNYGVSPASATLVSQCLDLSNMTKPVLQFRHHMYGADIGAIRVQWIKDGDNFWSNPMTPFTTTLTDEKDNWSFYEVDLSAQAGNLIKLRFIAQKSGFGVAADIAFDDIVIVDKANTDVGVDAIINPAARINLVGGPAQLKAEFKVRNFGKNAQTNVPITYTITPTCGSNAGVSTTYTFTHSASIPAGGNITVTDNSNTVAWPTGTFEMYAYTGKANDNNTWNDSAYVKSAGWPEVYIQSGFVEDFESCNNGDSSGFFVAGALDLWKVDQINALGNNNGMATRPNQNVPGGLEEFLYFPRFIGFDTIAGAELRLVHDVDLGAGDVALIEFQGNGTWNTLGFWDPQNVVSTNWYNTGTSSVGDAWAGAQGQMSSTWPLSTWNFSAAPLILRARLKTGTGNSDGWNLDKVEVYIPPQNSAAPIDVTTVEYLPVPDQNNHLKTLIKNTGAKVLDSCLVEFSTDGGTTWSNPEQVVFNPPLVPRKTAWYEFTQDWVSPTSGLYNVCVRTSRPDSKPDNDPSDDQICADITVLDKIIMSVDSSYCNDFDDPSLTPWLTLNAFVKDGLTAWELGTPAVAPLVSANSGSNAWMTDLDSNYKKRDSSALYTPVFRLDSGQTYTYEFMHAFSTEIYHDGGTVDVTFDGGISWHTVGTNLYGATWFNTSFVTSLDVFKPGWTGLSNGWQQAKLNLAVDTARNAIFRFRFGSDETINKAGWAIDDFCFYKTSDNDKIYVIGQEELEQNIGVGNIHPNPTSGIAQLPISFQSDADVLITVRNTQGQILEQRTVHGTSGIQTFTIETSSWASGMYLVETVTPLGTDVQRLIVE